MLEKYERNGMLIKAFLEDGKTVEISGKYIDNMVQNLEIDEEEAILTWLEDEEYLINDDQVELNDKAKANKANKIVKADTIKKKTQKERVRKENPVKEMVITQIAEMLTAAAYQDVVIENKGKLITFRVDDREFKIDLVEKRKPKEN